ncbi:MAG TPA: hypothetical protein VGO11_24370 [Chthoniobacteraceae bacterium]|jgi:tetratricopeptide (TPR) repeat protein|nr:hypothetical protein [Chthoniobacteraceae bacterium]
MNPRELKLKPGAAPVRPAAGVFLPGGDAAAWLAELARWAVPHEELKLFVVPRAAHDRTAGGLLVLLPAGGAPPGDARGLLLGTIDGRLFLPVDAELSPPVTTAEVRELCRAEVTLFHPGLGALEFEAGDGRRVWDLLERPATNNSADWNAAVEGTTLSSRLTGVTFLALPGGLELYGDASQEIGPEPITGLPAAPHEPPSSVPGRLRRALRGMGATAVGKIFSLLPKTGLRRTWVNDVLDWAAAKLAGVSEEMEHLRNRELHRLAEMLDSDPERGLRHALPLAGPPGRGRAAPGAQLGSRDPRLNLSRIGGGRPSDPWDVPAELRRRLLQRYRELALREQRLGRFQRAAYIHAELLGDLSAAAAVLKEGRFFAEAAALYRDHLHQSRVAAECYVAGGLFAEAIAIYEVEKAFLEIGDLQRRLENEPAAAIAFRRAVAEKMGAQDYLTAALLLEDRLRAPDEALAVLAAGWPDSNQAAQCLTAEFSLLGRLGRHEAARRRLDALAELPAPSRQRLDLAEVMKSVGATYPDRTVRPAAVDLARVKVSEALGAVGADEIRRGVRILHELAPEDRLLARDSSRFVAEWLRGHAREVPPPEPPARLGATRPAVPQIVHKFRLPGVDSLETAKLCGRTFLAVARQRQRMLMIRGDWRGRVNAADWYGGTLHREALKLVLDEHEISPASVVPFAIPLPRRPCHLAATGAFPKSISVGVPSWMSDGVAAIATSAGHWWTLRGSAGEFILESRGEDGRLTGSTALTPWLNEITEPVEFVSLLALQAHVWVALGRHVFLFGSGREPRRWACEFPIIGLEPSAPFLPRAALARCTRGACVFWADQPQADPEMLAAELVAPHAAFLRNGAVVLLSTGANPGGFAGRVLDLDRRGLHGATEFTWPDDYPQALTGTDTPAGFAIFTRAGEVHVHNVPSAKR